MVKKIALPLIYALLSSSNALATEPYTFGSDKAERIVKECVSEEESERLSESDLDFIYEPFDINGDYNISYGESLDLRSQRICRFRKEVVQAEKARGER